MKKRPKHYPLCPHAAEETVFEENVSPKGFFESAIHFSQSTKAVNQSITTEDKKLFLLTVSKQNNNE